MTWRESCIELETLQIREYEDIFTTEDLEEVGEDAQVLVDLSDLKVIMGHPDTKMLWIYVPAS